MFQRLLLGPGPTNCAPSVLEAASLPTIGHLDPTFSEIMDELQVSPSPVCIVDRLDEVIDYSYQVGLRQLFHTNNEVCFAGKTNNTIDHQYSSLW